METCIATPPPEAPEPQSVRAPGIRGVPLVVDDPDLQGLLARRFSRSGYRVVGAPSAEAATAVCVRWRPDVVLIDETTRGGLSGRDIARSLQRRVPDLRAVIVGATEGTFEKVDAIAAAAASLLTEVAAASHAAVARPTRPGARDDGKSRRRRPTPASIRPPAPPRADAGAPVLLTSSGKKAESDRPSRSSAPRR